MSTPVPSSTPNRLQDDASHGIDRPRRRRAETKASFKTTELIAYVAAVVGVLIASLVVDVNEDGQGFSAYQGWFLVTLLTIGYLVSRGLAKSGSHDNHDA
ncbi:MAG TPA: hypothetical protein VF635_09285 [Propionibacteriaceae bacterium]